MPDVYQFFIFFDVQSETSRYIKQNGIYSMRKQGILLLIMVLLSQICVGQNALEVHNLEKYRDLEFVDRVPKYLLTRKSVVFISYPNEDKNPPLRGDWKSYAEEIHTAFRRIGIDAVGYYHMDDIVSGTDPGIAFAAELKKRQVQYVIIIEKLPSNPTDSISDLHRLVITAFDKKDTFISSGKKALEMEFPGLPNLLKQLSFEVVRAELEHTNFLISDKPEFFTDVQIIRGKRFPSYARDLKVEKLIVPRFPKLDSITTSFDPQKAANVKQYNRQVDQWNAELEEIMETYPLDYELTDFQKERDIYKMGYQFALCRLNTTGKTIRQLLNYDIDNSETDYISIKAGLGGATIKSIPVDAPVFKYYVKHVNTKDTYVSGNWDADLTWQDALRNWIFNMKTDLKLKD